MKIKELTVQAFTEYAKNSPLKNYMQTEEYARFMGEIKYNYDYVGLVDDNDVIVAASLILWKKIGLNMRYGYAPKGFLINYYDITLVRTFLEELKKFYSKKNMIFIKINPEIVIGEVNKNTFNTEYNPNLKLKQDMQSLGFLKLKDNLYFESVNPRFNSYINLKTSDIRYYSKTNRNKVRNSKRKGLSLYEGKISDIDNIYKTFASEKPLSYYKNLLTTFKDKIDILLVKVDFEEFIKNSQSLYEIEENKNGLFNEILHRSNKETDLNRKMSSDSKLSVIKNEIITATEGLRTCNNVTVAAALVVKYENRVHILESAFDRKYSYLNANYFLYHSLIDNYKMDYDYLDIGGVSGDFKGIHPYKGLNRFKIGFNPNIYEYIGEFDYIINRTAYDTLLMSGKLANEFNKKIEK